jgi:hypothetical protein
VLDIIRHSETDPAWFGVTLAHAFIAVARKSYETRFITCRPEI